MEKGIIMPYELIEDEPQQEGIIGKGIRNVARTGARALESVVGLPGDIVGVMNTVLEGLTKKLNPSSKVENIKPPSFLPGSESLREKVTSKISPGGYLEPKTDYESLWDSFVGDLAQFVIPIGGQVPVKQAIKLSGLGNLAGWGAQQLGYDPSTQAKAKVGTMLLSSLIQPTALKGYVKHLYDSAEKSIPVNASIDFGNLTKDLQKSLSAIKRGDNPNKQFIIDRIQTVLGNVKKSTNKINVQQAWELKKDMNEWLGKDLSPKQRHYVQKLSEGLNGVLSKYGEKNKEFLSLYKEADDIWGGLAASSTVKEKLNKWITEEHLVNPIMLVLLGLHPAKTLGQVAGLITAKEGVNVLEPVIRSKRIRSYYGNVIKETLNNNKDNALKYVAKLNKEIDKELPQQNSRWEFID